MKKTNERKKSSGVTLVALTVTVIVLIILSSISINMILGDEGMIKTAQNTKNNILEKANEQQERLKKLKDDYANKIISEDTEEISDPTPVYAVLYNDGTLVLSSTNHVDPLRGEVVENFGIVEDKSSNNYWSASEYNSLVTKVSFYDKIAPSTTAYYFCDLNNLTSFENMRNLKTNLVTDMQYMFSGCSSLTSIDVRHFNTSNVTNMTCMFEGKNSISTTIHSVTRSYSGKLTNLDLRSFDTSNVTRMYGMFKGQVLLQSINLSSFNTSNVTSISSMFEGCPSLVSLDLSSFDTSKVESIDTMFWCDVSTFEQGDDKYFYYNDVRDMPSSLTRIYVSDGWDTSNVTIATTNNTLGYGMFKGCSSLIGAISYDSSKTDLAYANYTTGYLTYKSNT